LKLEKNPLFGVRDLQMRSITMEEPRLTSRVAGWLSGGFWGKRPPICMFLRNEPTDFMLENSIYPTGLQWFTEEYFAEKRWVRFPKRTHWEGVFEGQTKEIGWFWGRIWGTGHSHVDRLQATDS
jgi:hypothetical protein